MRPEQDIFDDVTALCASPGYAHALAYICFRDNAIRFENTLEEDDVAHLFAAERLLRTEQSTLIGLLLKHGPLNLSMPPPETLTGYIEDTRKLLEELHHSFNKAIMDSLEPVDYDVLSRGDALREPIFYGGESAYSFQYLDYSVPKYRRDNQWLLANKGFTIEQARKVALTIGDELNSQATDVLKKLAKLPAEPRTFLPLFLIDINAIEQRSGLPRHSVRSIFTCFSVQHGELNRRFQKLHDFNVANATPLLQTSDGRHFILFNYNSLSEALYVGPYYWMMADPHYRDVASINRGKFAEEFACERLATVFDPTAVYSNVTISSPTGDVLGEIDILVLYSNRAVVVQVKSKQLTLESRAGNDNQIRKDFKGSTQDSYDQAESCAKLLLHSSQYQLSDAHSRTVPVPDNLAELYPMCVVSDHYPALSSQVRSFLRYSSDHVIQPPMVLDLFALDVMTEMLPSPIKLLSYINRRVNSQDQVLSHDELTVLAYHLQYNLWFEDKFSLVWLGDDFTMALDVAMLVRRTGVSGSPAMDGFITKFDSTSLGTIVGNIERRPSPTTIDVAFLLLSLSEDAARELSDKIDLMANLLRRDGRNHDASIFFQNWDTGMTIHCNRDPAIVASRRLFEHSKARRYSQKAKMWFGICIGDDRSLRIAERFSGEWKFDPRMESAVRKLDGRIQLDRSAGGGATERGKVGRNDRCPCGSGKKYKHCCMP